MPRSRSIKLSLTILIISSLSTLPSVADQALPPPQKLTAQQDHQLMMEKLAIKSLRRGADGMNRQSPNYQNIDESKANPFPNLPDPLTLKDGTKVTSPEIWWNKRRPE